MTNGDSHLITGLITHLITPSDTARNLVTNFSVPNFLRAIRVGGVLDLLIKSYSPRLFMPVA